MAENLGNWPSERGPIPKIRPSDGCGRDAVPLRVSGGTISTDLEAIWEMSAKGKRGIILTSANFMAW